LVILLTVLYQYFVPFYLKENLYNFDRITDYKFKSTIDVFVMMMVFFIMGTFVFKTLNRRKSNQIGKINLDIRINKKLNFDLKILTKILFFLLVLSLFLVFLDYGFELFSRSMYLPNKTSTFKTVYQVFFIFISFLSALILKYNKTVSFLAIFTTLLVGISMGSRFASIYLIIYGFTVFALIQNRSKRLYFSFLFIVLVFFFFGFNISLRSETKVHGLIPYTKLIFEKPEILYIYALKNVYYSFIFGFYATADTINVYTFYSIEKLWTCLNPLPGRFTNWYNIADKLRSNVFAPFTAIGELAKFKIFFQGYYFLVGFYFAFVDSYIKLSFQNRKFLLPILHILILCMFTIFSFEYNLRSANRYIYYSLFLFIFIFILRELSKKNSKNGEQ
jgi:hypothetical protein